MFKKYNFITDEIYGYLNKLSISDILLKLEQNFKSVL